MRIHPALYGLPLGALLRPPALHPVNKLVTKSSTFQSGGRQFLQGPEGGVLIIHISISRDEVCFVLDLTQLLAEHCIVVSRGGQAPICRHKGRPMYSTLRLSDSG